MAVKVAELLLALALNFVHSAYSEHILSCNKSAIEPCPGEHQICVVATSECVCEDGFVMAGDECDSSSTYNGDSRPTVAVITIFTLVLVVLGLVLVVRKYNLIEYVRQKINLRRNNDVMYEDVMIGNDDPPLSP